LLLLAWYAKEARAFPWRKTRDPYQILVAEVMLQQTGVSRVLPIYNLFLAEFPTLEALADASTADVIRAWQGMGYNRRAVNLQRAVRAIVAEHGGTVPQDVDTLLRLPGVGPYTAAAISCFAFLQPVAVVDTNIRRVLGRLLMGPEPVDLAQAWRLAEEAMPNEEDASAWSQALMDLGSTVCLSRKPRCAVCPVHDLCIAAPAFVSEAAHSKQLMRVAESPSTQGYYDTSRYYRGRVVDVLRRSNDPVPIVDLGTIVKPEYRADEDEAWLRRLIDGLERDGLLHNSGDAVMLP
jgi:A/G-specific adenine glycosylase